MIFLINYISWFLSFSKTIMINIIDCEEYEKNKNFYVELGEPRVSNRETEYYDIVSSTLSSPPGRQRTDL